MIKSFLKKMLGTNDAAEPAAAQPVVVAEEPTVSTRRTFTPDETYPCVSDVDLPFESLNPIQSCFRDNYDSQRHTVAEAPTGTGKTVLAYIASRAYLDLGMIIILLAPTRELVKSLYNEAVGVWGAKVVGQASGSDKAVEGKHLIVTTPEGYLAALRARKEWTTAGLMIVDEAHNLVDTSRGGELDVAMTIFRMRGGKLLLMSGTFPVKDELAEFLDADLFVSKFRRTKITVQQEHVVDDLDAYAFDSEKQYGPEMAVTAGGYVYNRGSVRLKLLKDMLRKHDGESVLVFAPTKAAGFVLAEALVCPFHCADIDERDKDRIIREFRAGTLKTLVATTTLSQGVNTPCDVVIVFGARRGRFFLDSMDVWQMFGRGGRGRDEATAYILGDKIELFHAQKPVMTKSLPVPAASMVLTGLSIGFRKEQELVAALQKTFAGSRAPEGKAKEMVSACLADLRSSGMLAEQGGNLTLTKEGLLVARYYFHPDAWIKYKRVANQLLDVPAEELNNLKKGIMLLSVVIPGDVYTKISDAVTKGVRMQLTDRGLDKDVSVPKIGLYSQWLRKPTTMPPYVPFQLNDIDRWMSMFKDMEKHAVMTAVPGKEWLDFALREMKKAGVKMQAALAKKKASQKAKAVPEQLRLCPQLPVDQMQPVPPPPEAVVPTDAEPANYESVPVERAA